MVIKVGIVGSRKYPDTDAVLNYLNKLNQTVLNLEIISGGAPGVDSLAKDWANKHVGVSYREIRPLDPSSKIDYLFRNVEIISKADYVVVFWDGISKGSKFVIDYCQKRGLYCMVVK